MSIFSSIAHVKPPRFVRGVIDAAEADASRIYRDLHSGRIAGYPL